MVVVVYGTDSADRFAETIQRVKEQTEKTDLILVAENIHSFSQMANERFCDYLIYDDILFVQAPYLAGKNSIRALKRALAERPYIGIAMPAADGQAEGEGRILYSLDARGGIFLLSKYTMEKVGFFDEAFGTVTEAIRDYMLRAIVEGYIAVSCTVSAFYLPAGHMLEQSEEHAEQDLAYLKRKWGMKQPDRCANRDMVDLMEAEPESPIRVLEVGCGCGTTLLAVKNRYPNADVHGIETNEAEAQIASRYFDVGMQELQERIGAFEPNSFDYVIFDEALNLRREPEKELLLCQELLKEGGCILAGYSNYKKLSHMLSKCGYRAQQAGHIVKAKALGNQVYGVPPVETYQERVNELAKMPYLGEIHLWKYLIDNLSADLCRMGERNVVFHAGIESDAFREAEAEELEQNERLLEGLTETEVLFAVTPFRRFYKGKYDQTAIDDYIDSIDSDRYLALEPERKLPEGEYRTRNRHVFSAAAVTTKYGLAESDRADIAKYLEANVFLPMEESYQVKLHPNLKSNAIIRASMVVKERNAYLAFFSEVLRRVKPKVIVYVHGPIPWVCYLDEAARKQGIPTVEIAHGFGVWGLVYPPEFRHAQYYLTHSPLEAEGMREFGYENVFAVGKPFIYSRCENTTDAKTVKVGFVSSTEPGFLETALRVAARLQQEAYQVYYKPHSSEALLETEREEAERVGLELSGGGVDIRDFLKEMDIMVGITSSAIADALPYTHIKVIVMRQEKDLAIVGNAEAMCRLAETGDVVMVSFEEELYREIRSFKKGKEYRPVPNSYWPVESDHLFRDFIEKQILAGGNVHESSENAGNDQTDK